MLLLSISHLFFLFLGFDIITIEQRILTQVRLLGKLWRDKGEPS